MNRIRISGEVINIRLDDDGKTFLFDIHDNCNVVPCKADADILPVRICECCRARIEGTFRTLQKCELGRIFTTIELDTDDIQLLSVA